MKYDNMVKRNREVSREKVRKAKAAIRKMIDGNEPVTVCRLTEQTGLSREFFYKNMEVRDCLLQARKRQEGMIYLRPQKAVIDKALEIRLKETRKELDRVREENRQLKEENDKLRNSLRKRDLGVLRNL